MPLDRAANLLGALCLVVTDRTADAMADAGGRPESAAAALSALLHFLDRPSVDLLRQVLGLTSSGTVRLLDRLEGAGYVRRGPGADGRSAAISLTESGRAAARQVAWARAEVLDGALAALSEQERADFGLLARQGAGRLHPRAGRHPLDLPSLRHRHLPRRARRLPGRQRRPGPPVTVSRVPPAVAPGTADPPPGSLRTWLMT